MSDKIDFNRLFSVIEADAKERETAAGYGGRWDDGGASNTRERIRFFQYGMTGQLPPEWKKYLKYLDPEYKELQRLKSKFGE